MDEKTNVDLCCRSLFKCDALKHIELNHTNDNTIRNCECVHSFQTCLQNLKTSLSHALAFIHTINTTKCYANDHPMIKCTEFEAHGLDQLLKFNNSSERKKIGKRCIKYELDGSKAKEIQTFDLPLNKNAISSFTGKFTNNHKLLCSCFCLLLNCVC